MGRTAQARFLSNTLFTDVSCPSFVDADSRVVELVQDVIDVTAQFDTPAKEVRTFLVEEGSPGSEPHHLPIEARPPSVDAASELLRAGELLDLAVHPTDVEVGVVRVVGRRDRPPIEEPEPVEGVWVVLDPVRKADLRARLPVADRRPVAAGRRHLRAHAEAEAL